MALAIFLSCKNESASADLRQHKNDPQTYTLLRVYSRERGNGHASGMLKSVCEWADEHGITLWLEAGQYGDSLGLTNQQLENWYGRHGFISMPEKSKRQYTIMIRNPIPTQGEQHDQSSA